MPRPRIFVSSSYYDLKHLRSALESFIQELGFEPVLSEKGSIVYAPDISLEESCYREVEQSDIMLLIVGGRYGSPPRGSTRMPARTFYTRYDSITRTEFRSAVRHDVPLYIAIERAVHNEYQTFLKNHPSTRVRYAHAGSVNTFHMITEILSLPRNNAVFPFDHYQELEAWLREQWAGLFGDLLRRKASTKRLQTMAAQINMLTEANTTLRRYVESLMGEGPAQHEHLIETESKRLGELERFRRLAQNDFVDNVIDHDVTLNEVGAIIESASSVDEILDRLVATTADDDLQNELRRFKAEPHDVVLTDINDARKLLGVGMLRWKEQRGRTTSSRKSRRG
jgi:hypothetical protein